MRCSPTSEHKLSEKDRDRSSRSGSREILYLIVLCECDVAGSAGTGAD